ncbi:secreted peptidase [Leifsonia rubra CMS 76R]|nr:secreted peptidase [Leifsonia rubra CMS 76R]
MRGAIISAAVVLIFVGTLGSLLVSIDPLNAVFRVLPLVGIAGMLFASALIVPGVKLLPTRDAVQVTSPVVGRWLAINSPATKVPSHGVRAMIDGVVVKVDDSQRDHRARSTVLAVVYMMFEGAIRELGGPRLIVGNHVTIRCSDGIYALVAHLQQGPAIVREGDVVVAGQRDRRMWQHRQHERTARARPAHGSSIRIDGAGCAVGLRRRGTRRRQHGAGCCARQRSTHDCLREH